MSEKPDGKLGCDPNPPWKLTPEESAAFLYALMNPSEPNEAMRRAAQRYREYFGEKK